MTLLFRIVYAAHANGTHHKLALDALRHLQVEDKQKWCNLFLKHAERFLEGSKAPDKTFKDFKNHVYHVRDNGWGGAPAKAQEWYGKTVAALKAEDWEEAVYSAGVLSHYYTDPIQPLHTAQSDAENAIHRASEWSISKTYNDLKKRGAPNAAALKIETPAGDDCADEMVRTGATHANQYYESLIAHYNFDRGVVAPEEGFNDQGKEILAGLITYAATGFAKLLDRAIADAGVAAPDSALTIKTVLAALQIPVRWVTNKLEDSAERKLVQAMYDELQATGTVEVNLPEDDRTVRDLYTVEVLQKPAPQPEIDDAKQAMRSVREALAEATDVLRDVAAATIAPAPQEEFYLNPDDDVERAPSIGPKTAARLEKADIRTVADLLRADPEQVAWKAGVGYISAEAVKNWQDQAGLVCTMPKLRGTHAKILVGVGLRDITQIAKSDPYTLLTAVTAFLTTEEGEGLVRPGKEPDLDTVTDWIDRAILVAPQMAA